MKINAKIIVALLGVAVCGFLAMRYLRDPIKEIKRDLDWVRAHAEVSKGEQPLERLSSANEIVSHFDSEIAFDFPLYEEEPLVVVNRGDLRQKIIAARTYLSSLEINLADVQPISISSAQALIELTVSALGSSSDIEGQFFEQHRVQLEMTKRSGKWIILKVKHLKNLREQE